MTADALSYSRGVAGPAHDGPATDVVTTVEDQGWCQVHVDGSYDERCDAMRSYLERLGEPLHAYHDYPYWKPVGVDLEKAPGRVTGVGLNSLHLDCVNAEHPPDYLALLCIRPDPLGGGASLLVDVTDVKPLLSSSALDVLGTRSFRYGGMNGRQGVGGDGNPFAVLDDGEWACRYTGRFLEQPEDPAFDALLELDRVLMQRATAVALGAGDAVIIDQRRVLHGRLPLGQGQDTVAEPDRRLIVQAYARRTSTT